MLKNYLIVALRTLRKQKLTTAINVGGLALGIVCCLLLFLFVRYEWTYDHFHDGAEHIFRLVSTETQPNGLDRAARTPLPLAAVMSREWPGVENAVRVTSADLEVHRSGGDQVYEEEVLFADSNFFQIFTFPLAAGTAATALDAPDGVVLTRQAARKYFGEAPPVGQTLTIEFEDEARAYRVVAVAEDPPSNSSIPLGLVLPFSQYRHTWSDQFWGLIEDNWDVALTHTFVRLADHTDVASLRAQLPDLVDRHYEEAGRKSLQLQALTDVHLTSGITGGLTPPSDPRYSYILAVVALVVLLMACINFTTLALGRSTSRAPEVGVRKTLGAYRWQVAAQFWGEALLTALGALVLGIAGARLLLPVFARLMDTPLQFDGFDPTMWIMLALLLGIVALLAGGYPALVLSRFHPIGALRSEARLGGRKRLVQALVVVQFGMAIALVTGIFVMARQLDYLSHKSLGFNEEQVVLISPGDGSTREGGTRYDAFRQEALQLPSVAGITSSLCTLIESSCLDVLVQADDTTHVRTHVNAADSTFTEVMQISLKEGRSFGRSTDADAVLVNEAFVDAMGWQSPIGKRLPQATGGGLGDVLRNKVVVGVVQNFHFQPPQRQIAPLVVLSREAIGSIAVRLNGGDVEKGLRQLRTTWQRVAPETPFEYEFLDEVVRRQYEAERRWQALMRYAAGFALLIACVGLFGLATYTAQQRTKEIGIRKVLGASEPSIAMLLSKDFALLVAIAFVLATPVAYVAARRWLQDFAYHIDLRPWVFVGAGVLVLAVALLTVSFQAVRAALADPVESLRYE